MKKPNVFSLLKKGWTKFTDPERENRLGEFTKYVHRALSEERKNFDFHLIADRLHIPEDERQEVIERLFKKCVERAWSDGELSETESRSLKWIGQKIGLSDSEANRLMVDRALDEFDKIFCESLNDGQIDDREQALLQRVAAACDSTPQLLIQSRFQQQGEGFIRNLFVECWKDGKLDSEEWNSIKTTMTMIGMTEPEFRTAIQAPAKQIIEHSLADFQSDGEISKGEEHWLEWMLNNLIWDRDFSSYVRGQITETKLFSAIVAGQLPSINPPNGVALRAGELVHYCGPSDFSSVRRRSKSTSTQLTCGSVIITDDRMVFVSPESSFQILHTRVLGFSHYRNGFDLQCSGKGAGFYDFGDGNRLACAIWLVAIGKANQTIVAKRDDRVNRHIPRDVRQRVWQKYGGRCAECSADQYLEFDHIVPIAKGGSNGENNVQLLCRRCNNAKSDAI